MKKYWVYIHTTPDGMVYVGFSGAKHTSDRWKPTAYKQTSLQPYIEKWGWENIKHEVVKDNLSKEDVFKIEDELIKFYKERGVCINIYNSGGFQCDGKNDKQYYKKHKEQYKEYYQTHKDEISKRSKEWREKNKEHLREYEKNRKEKHREQHKQWIEKHREEYNRYMREYRKKKKEVV